MQNLLLNIALILFSIAMGCLIFRLGVVHGIAEVQKRKDIRYLDLLLKSAWGYNKMLRGDLDELERILRKYLEKAGHKDDDKSYYKFLKRSYDLCGEKW